MAATFDPIAELRPDHRTTVVDVTLVEHTSSEAVFLRVMSEDICIQPYMGREYDTYAFIFGEAFVGEKTDEEDVLTRLHTPDIATFYSFNNLREKKSSCKRALLGDFITEYAVFVIAKGHRQTVGFLSLNSTKAAGECIFEIHLERSCMKDLNLREFIPRIHLLATSLLLRLAGIPGRSGPEGTKAAIHAFFAKGVLANMSDVIKCCRKDEMGGMLIKAFKERILAMRDPSYSFRENTIRSNIEIPKTPSQRPKEPADLFYD